jgi:hypothetical protein
MKQKTSLTLVTVSIVGAVALAGCGSNSYDAGTVEKYVRKSQEGKVRGLALGDATCPKDVKLSEGVTFQCTLEIAGEAAPYKVRLTDVNADKVTINLEPAKALIATSAVVGLVRDGLKPRFQDRAKITCGEKQLLVVDPGTRIGCIVTVGGERRQAIARVEDRQGRVTLVR